MFYIDNVDSSKKTIIFTIVDSTTSSKTEVMGYGELKKFYNNLKKQGEILYGCIGSSCTVYDFKRGYAEYNNILNTYKKQYSDLVNKDTRAFDKAVLVMQNVVSNNGKLPFGTTFCWSCGSTLRMRTRGSGFSVLFSIRENSEIQICDMYNLNFYIYKGELCLGLPIRKFKDNKSYVKLVNPLTLEKIGTVLEYR